MIFIRDSVLIRSGDASLNGEKPYVAKIASIWQEQPGNQVVFGCSLHDHGKRGSILTETDNV